ncbi:hypothetical protein WICMUC_005574 [Wickerhamomyces mucosus]|uniref:Zinc finger Mcm10/DnaG-type domain-containing protein n=1 Tax=Wickerhamomyces mucosus TaxID=1378264 RepID=A0A9P8T600_9ASCO|nr:hypothetical protein WICMUC_005574 [Wickerhamomyces mucosus]
MSFDSRELFEDAGEEFGALTDNSDDENAEELSECVFLKRQYKHLPDKNTNNLTMGLQQKAERLKREQEEIEKEKELLRLRKEQKAKRKIAIQEAEIKARENRSSSSSQSSIATNKDHSTSYFIKQLEDSKASRAEEIQSKRKLLAARVYTFDSSIVTQPRAVDETEHYSGLRVNKKYLKDEDVDKIFNDVKVLRLNKLFAKVYPPDFKEPQYSNWCTLGILYNKTEPMTGVSGSRYVILSLTDFKFTIDIFIFKKELISKYNKLKIGDIISVLNAEIFKKRENDSFGLKINHTMDCLLEIGTSKDFSHCSKITKNGTRCKNFINKSKESLCSFHNEQQFTSTAAKRMEFQSSYKIHAPVNRFGVKQQMVLGNNSSSNKKGIIIDDNFAPKTDRISKSGVYFTNSSAHKAFFNEDFVNKESLAKKKLELEKKRKDYELLNKLTLNKGKRQLDEAELGEQRALMKLAFKDVKNGIGFDPSSNSSEKGILSHEIQSNGYDVVEEFNEILKNRGLKRNKSFTSNSKINNNAKNGKKSKLYVSNIEIDNSSNNRIINKKEKPKEIVLSDSE